MDTNFTLDQALRATGELLARRGQSAAIVVVGGTALNLLHLVDRTTRDVDIIAASFRKKAHQQTSALQLPCPTS